MGRSTLAERIGNANGNAPPDSIVPPSESVPSQGTYSPGRYQPPPTPAVPGLDASPAWSECQRNYESICQQLTDARDKRNTAAQRLVDLERVIGTREPNAEVIAQIAAAAPKIADLQKAIESNDRAIALLERARRLGETTLRDLGSVEASRLRRPFLELHAREAQKVAELFTAALVAFDDFWRWAQLWPGVGSGLDFERPCPDNSLGLLVRLLFERAGKPWQTPETWSNPPR